MDAKYIREPWNRPGIWENLIYDGSGLADKCNWHCDNGLSTWGKNAMHLDLCLTSYKKHLLQVDWRHKYERKKKTLKFLVDNVGDFMPAG